MLCGQVSLRSVHLQQHVVVAAAAALYLLVLIERATCNVQRATATDSECPPKNSSAAAKARVPQFSFIVD